MRTELTEAVQTAINRQSVGLVTTVKICICCLLGAKCFGEKKIYSFWKPSISLEESASFKQYVTQFLCSLSCKKNWNHALITIWTDLIVKYFKFYIIYIHIFGHPKIKKCKFLRTSNEFCIFFSVKIIFMEHHMLSLLFIFLNW